jgi:hypothetical protein
MIYFLFDFEFLILKTKNEKKITYEIHNEFFVNSKRYFSLF